MSTIVLVEIRQLSYSQSNHEFSMRRSLHGPALCGADDRKSTVVSTSFDFAFTCSPGRLGENWTLACRTSG